MAGSVSLQILLDFSLSRPLDSHNRVFVLQYLWQKTVSLKDVNKYQSYLKHYSDEMHHL